MIPSLDTCTINYTSVIILSMMCLDYKVTMCLVQIIDACACNLKCLSTFSLCAKLALEMFIGYTYLFHHVHQHPPASHKDGADGGTSH